MTDEHYEDTGTVSAVRRSIGVSWDGFFVVKSIIFRTTAGITVVGEQRLPAFAGALADVKFKIKKATVYLKKDFLPLVEKMDKHIDTADVLFSTGIAVLRDLGWTGLTEGYVCLALRNVLLVRKPFILGIKFIIKMLPSTCYISIRRLCFVR